MGGIRRPFDMKPILSVVAFSLVLTGVLITLNSRSESDAVETTSRQLRDGSLLVARQVGQQSPSRLIVSPGISVGADGTPADVVVAGVLETADGSLASGQEQSSIDEQDVSAVALPATTLPSTSTVPPAAATTSAAPSVVRTTTQVPFSPPDTGVRATTSTTSTSTTTTTTTTTTASPRVNGRYSVAQVIDGTIGSGDGSNPNEESPMGRHDASLYLPQGWNWAQGPTRNSLWGNLGSNQFAEFRCAVIPEYGHNPPVPFRVNVRNGAYYQFANGSWDKAFDVALSSPANGGYLGQAGQLNSDPFSSGGHGRIDWRREADGSYSAPWNSNALMMHFWAGKRESPASGQTAEFLTSEMRLQQPDGQTVDLSQVKVLFQCGIDYYNSTGGQGTKVPGPGIAKYHRLTTSWKPSLWVTLPGTAPAGSTADFRRWLEANLPPDVRP